MGGQGPARKRCTSEQSFFSDSNGFLSGDHSVSIANQTQRCFCSGTVWVVFFSIIFFSFLEVFIYKLSWSELAASVQARIYEGRSLQTDRVMIRSG